MWYPYQPISQDIIKLIVGALQNDEVKSELAKQIRVQIDSERSKYQGQVQSYDSLTSGNVNMQAQMAASGYSVYGKTILSSNGNTTNQNVYKKMKNEIHYGRNPQAGYYNRGGFKIV